VAVDFQHVTVQDCAPTWAERSLTDEDVAALRATAEAARAEEMAAWEREAR
jgi:hypothetical protein